MARRSNRTPDPRLIDPRNRVALSKQVMRALGVRPGDYITFIVDEHGAVHLYKLDLSLVPPRRPPGFGPAAAAVPR